MAENMDNGGRLIPYEYLGNGSGTLNYNSSASESSSSSDEDAYEYTQRKEKFYRHLFNNPLKKIRFSVNSKNRNSTSDPSHSCVIDLEEKNIGLFNQVVGFNVISASIPNSYYTITADNQKLKFYNMSADNSTITTITINIGPGNYTASDLSTEIKNKTVAAGFSSFLCTYDSTLGLFIFTGTGLYKIFTFSKSLTKLLGFVHADLNEAFAGDNPVGELITAVQATYISNTLTSLYHADMRRTSTFDIEIHEIPSICCIYTDHSNNIVARIPVDASSGSIINYHSQTTDLSTNHFFPIKLSKLSINILDEDGELLHLNGTNYNMICEATVLGDLPEDF